MYISQLSIINFRCFSEFSVFFNDGMNVIIGENNAGKTTILSAIELFFGETKKRNLNIDDFHRGLAIDNGKPPEIRIELKIKSSGGTDTIDDLAVVASWLTKIEDPWEAKLTYIYFLPEKDSKSYEEEYEKYSKLPKFDDDARWNLLKKYIPKYVSRIYAGNPDLKNRVEPEYLKKFNSEFLDAFRDVENKLFTGQKTILKDTLNYFLDYDLKVSEKDSDIEKKNEEFQGHSKSLLQNISSRIDTEKAFGLVNFTGADAGGKPKISGNIYEEDIIPALKLYIKDNGYNLPLSANGLGYSNLIYISLILSKMQMWRSKDYGENAIIYPILLLEEPEAHLHPALQHYFLKSLKEESQNKERVRQIFVTTHSTHITSAVGLDSIICMTNNKGVIDVAYPGKVFSDTKKDQESKHYVERYLDATRSCLLFSKSVIFVEGISEVLLIPVFAEHIEKPLEKSFVSIINSGGITFKHFIKLFGAGVKKENKNYALKRNVACLTDVDPKKKEKKEKAIWKKCYPFELGLDEQNYEYKPIAGHVTKLIGQVEDCDNVKIYYNESEKGKTLEYDLAFENLDSDLLNTDDKELDDSITDAIDSCQWEMDEKNRARYAVSFYEKIDKAENAFFLSYVLNENLTSDGKKEFNLPKYIESAIDFVSHN